MDRRTYPVRRNTRLPVHWAMSYGNDEFIANGMVLDVAAKGLRATGSVEISVRDQLCLWVWPPEQPHGFQIRRATVLWIKEGEFAVEVNAIDPMDKNRLEQILDYALGWWLVPQKV